MLNKNSYTFHKAISFGFCAEHFRESMQSTSRQRIIHILLGVIESIPILGQIASLFEVLVNQHVINERSLPIKQPSVIYSPFGHFKKPEVTTPGSPPGASQTSTTSTPIPPTSDGGFRFGGAKVRAGAAVPVSATARGDGAPYGQPAIEDKTTTGTDLLTPILSDESDIGLMPLTRDALLSVQPAISPSSAFIPATASVTPPTTDDGFTSEVGNVRAGATVPVSAMVTVDGAPHGEPAIEDETTPDTGFFTPTVSDATGIVLIPPTSDTSLSIQPAIPAPPVATSVTVMATADTTVGPGSDAHSADTSMVSTAVHVDSVVITASLVGTQNVDPSIQADAKRLSPLLYNLKSRITWDAWGMSYHKLLDDIELFLKELKKTKDPEGVFQEIFTDFLSDEDRNLLFKYLPHVLQEGDFHGLNALILLLMKQMFVSKYIDHSSAKSFLSILQLKDSMIFLWDVLLPDFIKFIGTDAKNASFEALPEEKQILLILAAQNAIRGKNSKILNDLYENFPVLTTIKNETIDILYKKNKNTEFEIIYSFVSLPNGIFSYMASDCLEVFIKHNPEFIKTLTNKTRQEYFKFFQWSCFDQDKRKKMLEIMVAHGFEVEFPFNLPTGIQSTFAEVLFYTDCPDLGIFLVQNGAKITPRMEIKMKAELKTHPEYIELLKARGKITDNEIMALTMSNTVSGSREDFVLKMSQAKGVISLLTRKYASNPLIEDFSDVEKLRSLKKEVKLYLAAHSDDTSLKELYDEFCAGYDALVTHNYVLLNLRKISKDLRAYVGVDKATASKRLLKMFSIWHPGNCPTTPEASSLLSTITKVDRSHNWELVRSRYIKALEEVNRDPFWKSRRLTCVHGTKAIPGMFHDKAIIPSGMMDDEEEGAHVTFSGERCGSKSGINRRHISCSAISRTWYSDKTKLFDAPTPFMTSVVYAKQVQGLGGVETVFDFEASKQRVEWDKIKGSCLVPGYLNPRALQHCCSDILRLRVWDPEHKTYLGPLLATVEEEIGKGALPIRELEEIRKALTIKIAYTLSEEDKALISHPTPILFGSTTYSPIPAADVDYAIFWEEVLIKGKAEFGRDIQVAFVGAGDLADMATRVNRAGLKIFSMEIGMAIETDQMMRGETDASEDADVQSKISTTLQSDILPHYGQLLSEHPAFVNAAGEIEFVERPLWGFEFSNYEAYKKAVEETTALPRSIHGKMHAVRTSIAAQMWSHVYEEEMDTKFKGDQTLLAVAAASHDSQRQDEGVDHWDEESGKALHSYLASKGYKKEVCDLYAHALMEKDPTEKDTDRNPLFKSDEQRFIHDADNIEILRVLSKAEFKKENLAFVQEWEKFKKAHASDAGFTERAAATDSKLDELISEWNEFIQLTERPGLKGYLEYTPGLNYYEEVMKILKYKAERGTFGLIGNYLRKELADIKGEVSPAVLELIK